MGFYSALKNNKNMSCAGKWMELENSMLSKIKPDEETHHMSFLTHGRF